MTFQAGDEVLKGRCADDPRAADCWTVALSAG
jgi:hypothetical protein